MVANVYHRIPIKASSLAVYRKRSSKLEEIGVVLEQEKEDVLSKIVAEDTEKTVQAV